MSAKQILILLLLASSELASYGYAPRVGNPVPEFALHNVQHSRHNTITERTYLGKWQLLYFWSLGCSSSVISLVKMDSIQKRLQQDLQVIPIGRNHFKINEGIDEVFDRLRSNRNLDLFSAYDSALFYEWEVEAVPHIVIVDAEGIVRFITAGFDMSIEKVSDMIRGRPVDFAAISHSTRPDAQGGPGLLNDRLSPDSINYAAVLTRWNGEEISFGYEFDRFARFPEDYQKDGWFVAKMSLERLYQFAYLGQCFWYPGDTALYGKVYRLPVVKVENKSAFEYSYLRGTGLYNCYLKLPVQRITEAKMKEELQRTLALNFGYKVTFETREMPVWKLMATSKARKKLETGGGKSEFLGYNPIRDVVVRNYPIRKFLFLVMSNLPNPQQLPYIDATGIAYGIDAIIKTDMTSLRAVQKELGKYGLELAKGTKPMQVMVISD